jgi:hypothetical protein
MPALGDVLTSWHEFYTLLGTAAGTLVGLLFVAATVGGQAFSSDRPAPLRVFLSATVIHFSTILGVSLILLAPLQSWVLLGVMVLACGVVGVAYYGLAWYDAARDGLIARIDLEDRIWYAVLPVIAYIVEVASGILMMSHSDAGFRMLALSLGMLLVIGLHNAWDITVWAITRRRE